MKLRFCGASPLLLGTLSSFVYIAKPVKGAPLELTQNESLKLAEMIASEDVYALTQVESEISDAKDASKRRKVTDKLAREPTSTPNETIGDDTKTRKNKKVDGSTAKGASSYANKAAKRRAKIDEIDRKPSVSTEDVPSEQNAAKRKTEIDKIARKETTSVTPPQSEYISERKDKIERIAKKPTNAELTPLDDSKDEAKRRRKIERIAKKPIT